MPISGDITIVNRYLCVAWTSLAIWLNPDNPAKLQHPDSKQQYIFFATFHILPYAKDNFSNKQYRNKSPPYMPALCQCFHHFTSNMAPLGRPEKRKSARICRFEVRWWAEPSGLPGSQTNSWWWLGFVTDTWLINMMRGSGVAVGVGVESLMIHSWWFNSRWQIICHWGSWLFIPFPSFPRPFSPILLTYTSYTLFLYSAVFGKFSHSKQVKEEVLSQYH